MLCFPGTPPAPPEWWRAAVLLLSLHLGRVRTLSSSPEGCLYTADLVSCTGLGLQQVPWAPPAITAHLDLSHNNISQLESGSFAGLSRLETLRLSHNQLTIIHLGAFSQASGPLLRHLDLSSNQLQTLDRHFFQELPGLEELLLFNNRIAHVELAGLRKLRKVYLSHNLLTNFPFFSIQKRSHPNLTLLDLSSNRLPHLPLEDVSALPLPLQNGLYLHNNSLKCDCPIYRLFRFWEQRRFDSVVLFRPDYVCLVNGMQGGAVRFLLHRRIFDNCSLTGTSLIEQNDTVLVQEGTGLLLHCITSLSGRSVSFHWVAPNGEYVAPPGNNGSLRVFTNGSLEMKAVKEKDGGIYWCLALDQERRRNETWEVNVTVVLLRNADGESFNTGFTTLLGCVVTLGLVLMYLYLTPCRCPPCRRLPPPTTPTPGAEAGASILSPTPPTSTEGPGRKVSTNKHVVFLEPIREQQNGRLRVGSGAGHLGPGLLLGAEQTPPQRHQRGGETDSMMSVFSDTPIMLP